MLESSTAPDLTSSHTVACRFWADTVPGAANYAMLVVSMDSTPLVNLQYVLEIIDDKIGTYLSSELSGATVITTGAWHHAAVTFDGTTARVYLDAVDDVNGAQTKPAVTTARVRLGLHDALFPLDGKIAETGIWSAALTAAEITSLSKGYTPDQVRPGSLVAYWPLVRELIDHRGGHTFTATGTTVSDHAPVYRRHRRQSRRFTTAVAAGGWGALLSQSRNKLVYTP